MAAKDLLEWLLGRFQGAVTAVFGFAALLLFWGCSRGPSAVPLPDFDPVTAGKMAIELHDSNGDGALSGDELKDVPGIRSSLGRFDADSDQRVTAAEIAARLNQAFEHKLGVCPPFGCTLLLNGRPLAGATVEFAPEAFLGGSIHRAFGETDSDGVARVQIAPDRLPDHLSGIRGIQPGIYRVKIVHPDRSLPSRYHEDSELGQEISNESILLRPRDTVYRLSSNE